MGSRAEADARIRRARAGRQGRALDSEVRRTSPDDCPARRRSSPSLERGTRGLSEAAANDGYNAMRAPRRRHRLRGRPGAGSRDRSSATTARLNTLRRLCEAPPVRRVLAVLFVLLALPAPAAAQPVRSAIFFYPWYSNRAHDGSYAHWQQGAHTPPFDIASAFFPYRGVYSSDDRNVLRAQMRDMRQAGVDEVVSSWWGWGSPEDARLLAVRRAARRDGLTLAVQLEPYDGRTIDSIAADLQHLRDIGIRDVYVYRATDFTPEEWAALDLNLTGLRVFAQTALIGFAAKARFAGFYTYDILTYGGEKFERLCAEAHAVGLLCAPSVGPGYDAEFATGDPRIKPRDDGG